MRTGGLRTFQPQRRSRYAMVLAVITCVLALLLVPAQRGHGQRHQTAEDRATISDSRFLFLPYASRRHSPKPQVFGVHYFGQFDDENGLSQGVEAGARWMRHLIDWSRIEPQNTTPDNYNWTRLDESVSNAVQQGVVPIITIGGQPEWAAEYPMGPPYNPDDLLEFVGAMVERYDGDMKDDAPGSPKVLYYELYNEPDNTDYGNAKLYGLGYWGNNGTGYAELMMALRPVMKAANRQARLIIGGMALEWFQGSVFDPGFLDDVLAACKGQKCFDVMNFHYFPTFRHTWEQYGEDIIGKANYIRGKLAEYGYREVPLLCTETGWASWGTWGSDELQSRYAIQVFARSMAADLMATTWFSLQNEDFTNTMGLLKTNKEPKPAYWSYQTMTEMLGSAHYVRTLSSEETGSEQLLAYEFARPGGRLFVAWTEDGFPSKENQDHPVLPLSVRADRVRVTNKLGTPSWIQDGDDGERDGSVTVYIGGSPLFLELDP